MVANALRRRSVIDFWQSGHVLRQGELQQGGRVAFEDVNDIVRGLGARHLVCLAAGWYLRNYLTFSSSIDVLWDIHFMSQQVRRASDSIVHQSRHCVDFDRAVRRTSKFSSIQNFTIDETRDRAASEEAHLARARCRPIELG
jgi:hypothetical protein